MYNRRMRSDLKRIERQLEQILSLTERSDTDLNIPRESVSAWSPAEHLDHSLKVCSGILESVITAEPVKSRPITLVGRIVLFIGVIPRGRGRAPERYTPVRASGEEIRHSAGVVGELVRRAAGSPLGASRAPVVRHPVFGGLSVGQTLRFAEIHTAHHMKIVRDILRTPAGPAGAR
ncbi:MAG: DinB family protein [Acidobacteriota bacterium]